MSTSCSRSFSIIANQSDGELAGAGIPHAPIHTIQQVREMKAVSSKLVTTRTPDGKTVHLTPLAVDREDAVTDLSFAPRYSEHTKPILLEAGLSEEMIAELQGKGILP